MLRTTTLLALLLLSACRPRTAARRDSADETWQGPIVAITDSLLDAGGSDTVRFGQLRSGESAVQRLRIVNRAQRTTAIASYDRSCGCTTLEFDPQPLAPGAGRQVEVIFDSRGESGWQFKRLDIRLAGAQAPLRLFVEADVR